MPGPQPKPTALKKLHGNPGGRPLPKNEPEPESGIPDPPSWLKVESRESWDELAGQLRSLGVLTYADRTALGALVSARADWRAACDVIEEEGSHYERTTERGGKSIAAHPAVAIRNDAFRRMVMMLDRFGLSPAARTRVAVDPRAKPKSAFREYLDRGAEMDRKDELARRAKTNPA